MYYAPNFRETEKYRSGIILSDEHTLCDTDVLKYCHSYMSPVSEAYEAKHKRFPYHELTEIFFYRENAIKLWRNFYVNNFILRVFRVT